MFFDGPPTAGVPVETGSGTATGYDIGTTEFNACTDENMIAGYDVTGASLNAVGIRAENGAVATPPATAGSSGQKPARTPRPS